MAGALQRQWWNSITREKTWSTVVLMPFSFWYRVPIPSEPSGKSPAPPAKGIFSQSITLRPCSTANNAAESPLKPPPEIAMSTLDVWLVHDLFAPPVSDTMNLLPF